MRELALMLALALPAPQHLATIAVRAPNATLVLQVAKTDRQREIGLMNVAALPEHTGMIFVFPGDGPVSFWMKDTLVPLDMIFVAPDGTVRSIAERVPTVPLAMPDEDIPLEQGVAKYVIELPAGEAYVDGIVAQKRLTSDLFEIKHSKN